MGNVIQISSNSDLDLRKEEARLLAASALMPTEYQGERGRANCLIAIEIANRIGASPMMVAQNLHVIHGRPSWSSSFLIAAINTSPKFSKPLRYEEREEGTADWSMRAYTFDADGERVNGPWVSMSMAKAEGWSTKKGSKWVTMPELMLRYRSAAFFARTTCPDLTMGLLTADEASDIGPRQSATIEAPTPRAALESALGMDTETGEVMFNAEELAEEAEIADTSPDEQPDDSHPA